MLTLDQMREIAEAVMTNKIFFKPKARTAYMLYGDRDWRYVDVLTLVQIAFKAGCSYQKAQSRKKQEE